jgi:hypothetical protein
MNMRMRYWVTLGTIIFLAGGGAVAWTFLRDEEGVSGRLVLTEHVRQVGTILSPAITESSGVLESRLRPGVFWTHNDHGSPPVLHAIHRNGASVNRFPIAAPNHDWEDIAFDEEGNLYIGDIGDNYRRRPLLYVYRLPEPDPKAPAPSTPLPIQRRWQLRCPNERLNCEALVIWKGYGYLISKLTKQHPAGLYRFPLDAPDEPITLEHMGHLAILNQVTGADISQDGKLLAVLTYAGLYVYRIDGVVDRARKAQPIYIPIRGRRIEGCCFTTGGILITAETRDIFFCQAVAYRPLLDEPTTRPR